MSNSNFSTDALHVGHDVTKTQGTRAVPLYQSTSFVFNNAEHAANLFALAEPGYIYTRLNNPTTDVLEQRMAALEGGIAAVARTTVRSIGWSFKAEVKSEIIDRSLEPFVRNGPFPKEG